MTKSTAEIAAQRRRIDGLRDRYRRIADLRSECEMQYSEGDGVAMRLLNRSTLAALGDYMAAIGEK